MALWNNPVEKLRIAEEAADVADSVFIWIDVMYHCISVLILFL